MKKNILLLSTLIMAAISANLCAKTIAIKNETGKTISVFGAVLKGLITIRGQEGYNTVLVEIEKKKTGGISKGLSVELGLGKLGLRSEYGDISWGEKGRLRWYDADIDSFKNIKEMVLKDGGKYVIKKEFTLFGRTIGQKDTEEQATLNTTDEEMLVKNIEDGNLDVLKAAVEQENFDINSGISALRKDLGHTVEMTPLHLVLISALLMRKDDPNIWIGYKKIIDYLLENNANMQAKDAFGKTPCYYLAEWEPSNPFYKNLINENRPNILEAIPALKQQCPYTP
ncbi:hypothetical protein ACFLYA_02805 [Candidatus Dependentiae bacterium]